MRLESPLTDGVSRPNPRWRGMLIARAVEAKVPAAWVAGDEVYGADPRLRAAIRGHGLGYVLAVSANRRVPTAGRPDPRRCAPGAAAHAGLAETLRRCRQPRTPPLLVGLDRAAAPRTTPTPASTIC